jgi:hypothetical protein
MYKDQASELQRVAIRQLRSLISDGAEKIVSDVVRQINRVVRDSIRTETGLRLSDETYRGSVPIKVVAGFPSSLTQLIERYPDPTLWRLISLRPKLISVSDSLKELLVHWNQFEAWDGLPTTAKNAGPTLRRSLEISESLSALAAADALLIEISLIEDDILGAYWHGQHIEIYWMAITLFSAAFGVRIEDLTSVAMIHELAHAYTHLARDIDGSMWEDGGFEQSEPAVIEGLAQYYTATVTQKLTSRLPSAHHAYQTVLQYQSGPYHSHLAWFDENVAVDGRGEVVRSALLQARKAGKVTNRTWRTMLQHAQLRFPPDP